MRIQGDVVGRAARGGEAPERRGDPGREAIPSRGRDHQQGTSQGSCLSGGLLHLGASQAARISLPRQ